MESGARGPNAEAMLGVDDVDRPPQAPRGEACTRAVAAAARRPPTSTPAIVTPSRSRLVRPESQKYADAPPATRRPRPRRARPQLRPRAADASSARCTPLGRRSAIPGYARGGADPVRRLPLGARRPEPGARALPRRAHSGRVVPRRRRGAFRPLRHRCGPASAALGGAFAAAASAGGHRRRACSSSPTGRWAGRSGSGGCSAISAMTTAACCSAASTRGAARSSAGDGGDRAGRVRAARARAATRSTAEELARRLGDPALVARRRADAEPVARRAEPDRRSARADPRRAERAVGGAAARSCRRASSSPTAAPVSPRASCFIARRSTAGTESSIPARGANGRSAGCRSSGLARLVGDGDGRVDRLRARLDRTCRRRPPSRRTAAGRGLRSFGDRLHAAEAEPAGVRRVPAPWPRVRDRLLQGVAVVRVLIGA